MNKFANPFEPSTKKTERTANQKLVEWMNRVIKEENLNFGYAEQETSGKDRKQPDIILFKAPQSTEIVLVLELKPPFFDPLDFENVKEPAREKATQRQAPYFATSNFKNLYLFNTEKANKLAREEQQLVQKYTLSDIEDLNFIDEPNYKNHILKSLSIFLKDLDEFIYGRAPESLLPIDEVLIAILQEKVNVLSAYYLPIIEKQTLGEVDFRKKLRHWFNEQGWNFVPQRHHFIRAARQTAYLLINKILFYDVLRATDPQNFAQLKIPDDFTKGGMIARHLQNYFAEILKIDYETIYSADFIDTIAFPDDKNVIYHIRELVNRLNKFDFSQIEFEVLGRIFEGLIPPEERHILGQYFTQPDIVDLILGFAVRNEKDILFDPGCGAGTFLRRAYHLKKLINPNINHETLLPTLWGNDIAKFPATLATLNLAIADLRSQENYPRIVQKDFFDWMPGHVNLPESTKKVFLKSLGNTDKEMVIPKYFDAIVGNPPYTRQEEMDDLIGEKGQEYKERLIAKALSDEGGRPYARISKRAGLHAYFFVHATKFLKNGGRFGFIVSNSWLDVDYGKGLQEHFLQHYKIKAIIESKVERWFADADVNTCLVFLEKCSGENGEEKLAREENLVRFAYLKKPLAEFIPLASRIFEETVARKAAVEKLLQYIESKTSFFENEDLRVYCKNQKELWEEGFNEETRQYVGTKWGKYIRAPKIFFTILEKAKDKLVPLKRVADVRFGIKTGANEFFYLTEEEIKRRGIEKEFWMHRDEEGKWIPNYVIKSPKECTKLIVEPQDLKYRILMIHKDRPELKGTNILNYIREGEEKGYHKRPTCASRKRWWDLGKRNFAPILWPMIHAYRHTVLINEKNNVYADHNFFEIYPKKTPSLLGFFLFSSITILFKEIFGREYGGGSNPIKTEGVDLQKILVVDFLNVSPQALKDLEQSGGKLRNYKITTVFKELGSRSKEKVSMNDVNDKRFLLDKIVIQDILGLGKEEQFDVYKAIIELVSTRLKRAKSLQNNHQTKKGVDVSLLVKTIVDRIGGNKLGSFYQKHILPKKDLSLMLPEYDSSLEVRQTLLGFRLICQKTSLDFDSELEANYCKFFCKARWPEVSVPKDKDSLQNILPQLKKIEAKVEEAIVYYTEGLLDNKLQDEVERRVWQEVSKT
ncbi:hypothetical protein A2160_01270 [Candidatus Beckwithbacteria bacterium RBG_13_42_9]|uniref:site-specific DNA-methyltransferase (adenine-specific) n=1 Tax=Candidatus Beckwithbacteria bacterium RBG_13_42_9 TaxID=1797457 RepID=A0A1F5E4C3_9BACT|nr:MAG: hypothetical protein A2160_01270 [Candidatus Beckwithbacteria bacterium RBG_13_42_9]